jgi:hypothetical protein
MMSWSEQFDNILYACVNFQLETAVIEYRRLNAHHKLYFKI